MSKDILILLRPCKEVNVNVGKQYLKNYKLIYDISIFVTVKGVPVQGRIPGWMYCIHGQGCGSGWFLLRLTLRDKYPDPTFEKKSVIWKTNRIRILPNFVLINYTLVNKYCKKGYQGDFKSWRTDRIQIRICNYANISNLLVPCIRIFTLYNIYGGCFQTAFRQPAFWRQMMF